MRGQLLSGLVTRPELNEGIDSGCFFAIGQQQPKPSCGSFLFIAPQKRVGTKAKLRIRFQLKVSLAIRFRLFGAGFFDDRVDTVFGYLPGTSGSKLGDDVRLGATSFDVAFGN